MAVYPRACVGLKASYYLISVFDVAHRYGIFTVVALPSFVTISWHSMTLFWSLLASAAACVFSFAVLMFAFGKWVPRRRWGRHGLFYPWMVWSCLRAANLVAFAVFFVGKAVTLGELFRVRIFDTAFSAVAAVVLGALAITYSRWLLNAHAKIRQFEDQESDVSELLAEEGEDGSKVISTSMPTTLTPPSLSLASTAITSSPVVEEEEAGKDQEGK